MPLRAIQWPISTLTCTGWSRTACIATLATRRNWSKLPANDAALQVMLHNIQLATIAAPTAFKRPSHGQSEPHPTSLAVVAWLPDACARARS